jgi:hypothetical protein
MKKTEKIWEEKYIIAKTFFESMEVHSDNEQLIKRFCGTLRNPIIFDNKSNSHKIPYILQNITTSTVDDHLIGMSNAVLYIFKNEVYKRWKSPDDFKKTIRALQPLLKISTNLNNSEDYKCAWQFDETNINDCIKWNNKLKKVSINHLIDSNGIQKPVDDVWNEWYEQYSDFL